MSNTKSKTAQEPEFVIKSGGEYVESYNGGDEWEWTKVKKHAWSMRRVRAEAYLQRMGERHPKAEIVPANDAAKAAMHVPFATNKQPVVFERGLITKEKKKLFSAVITRQDDALVEFHGEGTSAGVARKDALAYARRKV